MIQTDSCILGSSILELEAIQSSGWIELELSLA